MRSTPLAFLLATLLGGLSTVHPRAAAAQDFIGIAVTYGEALHNTLMTEILIDAQRQTMGRGAGTASGTRDAVWPQGIREGTVQGHIFTVREIADMRGSDMARMRDLVDGEEIVVRGVVRRGENRGPAFDLIDPSLDGFRVWIHFRRDPTIPPDGSLVEVRGRVDTIRRTSVNLAEPSVRTLPAGATMTGGTGAGAERGGNAGGEVRSPATTRNAPEAPPAPGPPSLTFARSPEVTQLVAERLAEATSGALAAGRTRDELLGILSSGILSDAFQRLIQPYGMSDRDLADVLTAHLVLTWQVANDVPELDESAGYRTMRHQLGEALLEASALPTLSDPGKQAAADLLILGTMLIVARYQHGLESGDRQVVAAAMQDARDMVREYSGMDLLDYRITEQGMVEREE